MLLWSSFGNTLLESALNCWLQILDTSSSSAVPCGSSNVPFVGQEEIWGHEARPNPNFIVATVWKHPWKWGFQLKLNGVTYLTDPPTSVLSSAIYLNLEVPRRFKPWLPFLPTDRQGYTELSSPSPLSLGCVRGLSTPLSGAHPAHGRR